MSSAAKKDEEPLSSVRRLFGRRIMKKISVSVSVLQNHAAEDSALSPGRQKRLSSSDTASPLPEESSIKPVPAEEGRRSALAEKEARTNIAKKQKTMNVRVISLITVLFVILFPPPGISGNRVFVFCLFIR